MTAITNPPVIICVYGATGTGKSSFINDVTGGSLSVGHGQESCTDKVVMSPRFTLDGREIWLVDTPGFDDSSIPDSEVLEMIGDFMAKMYATNSAYLYSTSHLLTSHGNGRYETKQLISGIIYMHRIIDIRVGGVAKKNFRMLRELCGPNAMKNLIMCTNMWSEPPNPAWEPREKELIESPKCFEPAIAKGARVARYMRYKGKEHAHDIIRMCLENIPVATRYQEEISQGASVGETSAGRVLNEEMRGLMETHSLEIGRLIKAHEKAIQQKDEETREEVAAERARMDEVLATLKGNICKLNRSLDDEKQKREESRQQYEQDYHKQEKNIKKLEAKIEELEEKLGNETDPQEEARLHREQEAASKALEEMMNSLWASIYSGFASLFR